MAQYPNRDRVTQIAIDVLEDAMARAEHGIVERNDGHRLALAWLAAVGVAQDWQCKAFWHAMISNDTSQIGDFPRYCRIAKWVPCSAPGTALLVCASRPRQSGVNAQRLTQIDEAAGSGEVAIMCNLYRMTRARAEIADLFRAADHWQSDMAKDYVAPGSPGPVVIERDGQRVTGLMTWGVPNAGKPVTNVRNLESPFWRSMLARPHHRCLVPATEFQEWSTKPDPATGKRRAHWFSIPSHPAFAFAGIWRKIGDVPHFAFLTTEPNALVAPIHPKAMPVILDEADYESWLAADWPEASRLVAPYPSQLMAVA